MQLKDELARREVQYEEQVQTSKKEMLDAMKDYRDKVDDSKRWDKDGLMTKYEKLEGEQVVLVQELERIKRDNADKNDEIKKLLQRHQEDQRKMESLNKSRSIGKAATSRRDVRDLTQETAEGARRG